MREEQEENHAPTHGWKGAPPSATGQRLQLARLWETLPAELRQKALTTLSHVVTQQLRPAPDGKEVGHDDG